MKKENDNELIDTLDPRLLRECPFVRKDGTMTIAEYKEEMFYFRDHLEDYRNGTYKPLWQQKKEA